MRQKIQLTLDLSEPITRRRLMSIVGGMSGVYEVKLVPRQPHRSNQQNAWMWACIVTPFAEWLTETQGESVGVDVAHGILKDTLLRVPVVNKDGEPLVDAQGDPIMRTRSTTELGKGEFSEYCEDARRLLQELCDIEVADPDIMHGSKLVGAK